MTAARGFDFQVRKDDLHNARVENLAAPNSLSEGEVLLTVSRIAFTANNITYAAFGNAMSYWDFFPAPDGWGRIPTWGFADVIQSHHDDIATGERIYGYLPLSSHLVVRPARVTSGSFVDASEHRQRLPGPYNQYSRCAGDTLYRRDRENQQALFLPLFMTSFLIDDFLADERYFGADAAVLSSASSKTALGLAHLLSRHGDIEVFGLTSEANASFVAGLGCYDRVLVYDEIESLSTRPSVYVDMSGNGEVRERIHGHFDESLTYSCAVGAAHWDRMSANDALPGPRPTLFFAPDRIEKRRHDWGPGELQQRFAAAWEGFLAAAENWIEVEEIRAPDIMQAVYLDLLENGGDPRYGYIFTVSD